MRMPDCSGQLSHQYHVRGAIHGRLPQGMGVLASPTCQRNGPRQHEMLGLPARLPHIRIIPADTVATTDFALLIRSAMIAIAFRRATSFDRGMIGFTSAGTTGDRA
jgi:hypothetical protein